MTLEEDIEIAVRIPLWRIEEWINSYLGADHPIHISDILLDDDKSIVVKGDAR